MSYFFKRLDISFTMDVELNTDVKQFGSDLIGYPHIQEGGGNYVGKFKITDEYEKSNYKHIPTDDLSSIWLTNNRDNIDDLDVVLRNADINAGDVEYYGAKNLNMIADKDMWDFGSYLQPAKCSYAQERRAYAPKANAAATEEDTKSDSDTEEEEEYNLLDEGAGLINGGSEMLKKKKCFPTWLILIIVFIAIMCGMYFNGADTNTPTNPSVR